MGSVCLHPPSSLRLTGLGPPADSQGLKLPRSKQEVLQRRSPLFQLNPALQVQWFCSFPVTSVTVSDFVEGGTGTASSSWYPVQVRLPAYFMSQNLSPLLMERLARGGNSAIMYPIASFTLSNVISIPQKRNPPTRYFSSVYVSQLIVCIIVFAREMFRGRQTGLLGSVAHSGMDKNK